MTTTPKAVKKKKYKDKIGKKRRPKQRGRPKFTAKTADKHDLYQRSVQAPEVDSEFFADYFKDYAGRDLRKFREDFCGTFVLSTAFVKLHQDNEAICVDLDGPTLDWGRKHNLAKLDPQQQERVHIYQANVMEVHEPKADLIAAMNFSYCIFKDRPTLHDYVKSCYESLEPGGLMVMDMWGGSETQVLQEEDRDIDDGFTYVWDQDDFDPLTYNIVCRIHFEFTDGSKMRNAFVYDWRLWTPPDLSEAMAAAGFEDVHFLWDTEEDEDDSNYERVERGDPDEAWITYIVGQKR